MNLEKIENRIKVIDYNTEYSARDSHFLHAACRELIAEVKLTIVELEMLKKEYAVDKAVWEREKADLEAQVCGLEETEDLLEAQLASANETICGIKEAP